MQHRANRVNETLARCRSAGFAVGAHLVGKAAILPLLGRRLPFVPDTLYSLTSGFVGNAVLNVGFALLFAVPLAATFRDFAARD